MAMEFDHVAQRVPDIATAVAWYKALLPDVEVIYQDETWAFIRSGETKLAFVSPEQHPNHIAWRLTNAELDRVADEHGREIRGHRDGTRSFYLDGPGELQVELIAYPECPPRKTLPGFHGN